MTREAHAVIGANWGDEGKGLAVDAVSNRLSGRCKDVVAVRTNGGAQAGHGVERPDGGRHVFHHVGAGTFAGAATHLSRFFVAHPMMLGAELADLSRLGASPRAITIDPRAAITTPWDMAINQAVEAARGGGRHGSTGLGFGETIERQENGPRLGAADLWRLDLRARLLAIRDGWLPGRIVALGLDRAASPLAPILTGRIDLVDRFMEDCDRFTRSVALMDDANLARADAVVLEGAQGLQLDMAFGIFPHVTRSRTGLVNMLAVADEAGIETIETLYVTRCYATRHGAGPLPHEEAGPDGCGRVGWAEIVDRTNVPNAWQGMIRKAPLDADLLAKAIRRDLGLAASGSVAIYPTLGVTCLDQVRGLAMCMSQGQTLSLSSAILPERLAEASSLPLSLLSRGPTRRTVEFRPGPRHLRASTSKAAAGPAGFPCRLG